MKRSGYSLTLQSPKLAFLSGTLRKPAADVNSARWNGLVLATPKRPAQSPSSRRQFVTRKNSQSIQNQPPSNQSRPQRKLIPNPSKKAAGRRHQFYGCLQMANGTSLDNPLLSSFDSGVSLHTTYQPAVKRTRRPDFHPGKAKRPQSVPDAFKSSLTYLC